jgi:hypothetical protein
LWISADIAHRAAVYERRIAAINAVVAVCDAEEGGPSQPHGIQKRSTDAVDMPLAAPVPKKQKFTPSDQTDSTFSQAIASVCIKSPKARPTICFLCLGNSRLPESERLEMYKNSGSLSRHFINRHIKPFPNDMRCKCSICGEKLVQVWAIEPRGKGAWNCLPLV